jgi:hypothetical protein
MLPTGLCLDFQLHLNTQHAGCAPNATKELIGNIHGCGLLLGTNKGRKLHVLSNLVYEADWKQVQAQLLDIIYNYLVF